MAPYSVRLFFADGRPDGICTARDPNWIGYILVVPRSQFERALERSETQHAGVYFLIGTDEEQGEKAYIGQASRVGGRIREHFRSDNMSWWEKAVIITSSDNSLNTAHVRYLEYKFIEKANEINSVALANIVNHTEPPLNEDDRESMNAFLSFAMRILPTLQIDFLVSQARGETDNTPTPDHEEPSPQFIITTGDNLGITARARQEGGVFIVESGSFARGEWMSENPANFASKRLRERLVREGILVRDGDKLIFTQDCEFDSTTAAAETVLGVPKSGPLAWTVMGNGMTYRQWEEARLNPEN